MDLFDPARERETGWRIILFPISRIEHGRGRQGLAIELQLRAFHMRFAPLWGRAGFF
ncbi:hypothetical protein [Croceicoccus sp. Ery15]|uniref:hypothetical protein n=1 Tax=Croceicoccus sp. Ery15 TaxID=1703338 RepID=UPI001E4D0EC6|nr:hypothetical protein [Croceicoccus sp. Ery15]